MPAPALLLLLATLLPLVGAAVLIVMGRRLGSPLAGWTASGFAALSFGASLWALVLWCYPGGRHYHGAAWGIGVRPIEVSSGGRAAVGAQPPRLGWREVGMHVDSLTIAMFAMMTLVAVLVSTFAIGFMSGEPRDVRYFVLQSLLCFSVLGVVLSGTLAPLLVCWWLGGYCANRLIGFWSESPVPRRAAVQSFLMQLAADGLLMVGAVVLVGHVGTSQLMHIGLLLGNPTTGHPILLPGGGTIGIGLVTALGICLSFGAAGRAGQFPFHAGWGDATEAPTPAGALLQGGLLAASGMYLLARLFPILSPDAKLLLTIAGVATTVFASLVACAHGDLRRVIAFAMLAQFGLITVGLGVGSWGGAVFHLIIVAFVGTLLMLASGSVIRATGGRRRLEQLGGMWKQLPVTAAAFAIGALALAGIPGFSAYYSHWNVLSNAGAFATLATQFAGRSGMYWCFFALPVAASYLVAFALTRCWILTFLGNTRAADLAAEPEERRSLESSILWTPLLMLAVLSIFAGAVLGIGDLLRASVSEFSAVAGTAGSTAAATGFDQAWPLRGPRSSRGETTDTVVDVPAEEFTPAAYALDNGQQLYRLWGRWAWAVGLIAGIGFYARGSRYPQKLLRFAPLQSVHAWLADEMYFAQTYEWLFGRTTLLVAEVVERWGVQRASKRLIGTVERLAGVRLASGRRTSSTGIRHLLRSLSRSATSNGKPSSEDHLQHDDGNGGSK